MANKRISDLTSTATTLAPALQDTDQLPLARGGTTYNIFGSNIKSPILSAANTAMLTKVNSLSAKDSATIDLEFNSTSYALSAEVRDGSITTSKIASDTVRYSQLASLQTLSASPTLSAEAVQPRVAKAWVTFRGTGTVAISSAFNVSSVIKNSTGIYTINFMPGTFTDTKYLIAAFGEPAPGSNLTIPVGDNTTNARTISSIRIAYYDSSASYREPIHASVLAFSL